jgi:hypothetical protein
MVCSSAASRPRDFSVGTEAGSDVPDHLDLDALALRLARRGRRNYRRFASERTVMDSSLISLAVILLLIVGVLGLFLAIFVKERRRVGLVMLAVALVAAFAVAVPLRERMDAEAAAAVKAVEAAAREAEAAAAAAKEAERQQAEIAACKADPRCWGERALEVAAVHCPREIAQLATYELEWIDGLSPKFADYRQAGGGAVTVIGDQILFQNEVGAWQRYIYECDVDPEGQAVLAVRITPGRLD